MPPLAAFFDLIRDVPILRGVVAVILGWSFIHFARAAFYRPTRPATAREWADRAAYWFGRVIGIAILALGMIALVLDVVLLLLG